jgi:hypothetical protein
MTLQTRGLSQNTVHLYQVTLFSYITILHTVLGYFRGTADGGTVVKVLRYKSEEVAGSIPDGVIGIFH